MKKSKTKSRSGGMRRETRESITLMGNPVWRAFAKKEPVADVTQTTIGLTARKALYALSHGHGTVGHIKELLIASYSGAYLAECGCGSEFTADFDAARLVLLESVVRFQTSNELTVSAEEARVINVLLNLYEQQVQLVDKATMAASIVESYRRYAATEV